MVNTSHQLAKGADGVVRMIHDPIPKTVLEDLRRACEVNPRLGGCYREAAIIAENECDAHESYKMLERVS